MTDMAAFERRVADAMVHRAGPMRPVDDLAVCESVAAASRSHRWGFTMLPALKLVAASVILALAGSFLFAGLLHPEPRAEPLPAAATGTPPSVPTEGLLAGVTLHAVEVEPGVFRVTSDDMRELTELRAPVVAGRDGSVWLVSSGDLVRLGDSEPDDALADGFDVVSALEVAADGSAWVAVRDDGRTTRLLALEDGAWSEHPALAPALLHLEVTPRGRLWAASLNGVLGYLAADGSSWHTVDLPQVASRPEIGWYGFTARDSEIWARYHDGLWRYTNGRWEQTPYGSTGTVELPGDVIWGLGMGQTGNDQVLHRHDEAGWARWSLAEHAMVPFWGAHPASYLTAPDGSFWASWRVEDGAEREGRCVGVNRFDGLAWSRFLASHCVDALDAGPDGSVWLLARDRLEPSESERGPSQLYVITTEAVVAKG